MDLNGICKLIYHLARCAISLVVISKCMEDYNQLRKLLYILDMLYGLCGFSFPLSSCHKTASSCA